MWPKLMWCLAFLQDDVDEISVEVSHANGQWIMSGHHASNAIQLWDAKSGEVQFMHRTHDTNDTLSWFEFCPTGGLLAAR